MAYFDRTTATVENGDDGSLENFRFEQLCWHRTIIITSLTENFSKAVSESDHLLQISPC